MYAAERNYGRWHHCELLPASSAVFVPLQMSTSAATVNIHIERRRDATSLLVTLPADVAIDCLACMRALL